MSESIFFPRIKYDYPIRLSQQWFVPISSNPFNPTVKLLTYEIFKSGLGFSAGTYPSRGDNDRDQIILGQISPTLKTNYLPIYYKPNNPEFACQGAVSGSSFIARKKYNAITNAANKLRTTYGIQSGNALAYGVPGPGYTLKDRIGFPIIKTPVTTKNNDIKFCIINRTIRNMRNG